MVSTHLKNISQIGSFPQMKIKNVWNHHLDYYQGKSINIAIHLHQGLFPKQMDCKVHVLPALTNHRTRAEVQPIILFAAFSGWCSKFPTPQQRTGPCFLAKSLFHRKHCWPRDEEKLRFACLVVGKHIANICLPNGGLTLVWWWFIPW